MCSQTCSRTLLTATGTAYEGAIDCLSRKEVPSCRNYYVRHCNYLSPVKRDRILVIQLEDTAVKVIGPRASVC